MKNNMLLAAFSIVFSSLVMLLQIGSMILAIMIDPKIEDNMKAFAEAFIQIEHERHKIMQMVLEWQTAALEEAGADSYEDFLN